MAIFLKTLIPDLRHWLSKQPSYNASREFEVGTARSGGMDIEGVDSEAEEGDASGSIDIVAPHEGRPTILTSHLGASVRSRPPDCEPNSE